MLQFFNKIVKAPLPPKPTNVLWVDLKNNEIKRYSDTEEKWVSLVGSGSSKKGCYFEEIEEGGIYFVDENNNIGSKFDLDGFLSINSLNINIIN